MKGLRKNFLMSVAPMLWSLDDRNLTWAISQNVTGKISILAKVNNHSLVFCHPYSKASCFLKESWNNRMNNQKSSCLIHQVSFNTIEIGVKYPWFVLEITFMLFKLNFKEIWSAYNHYQLKMNLSMISLTSSSWVRAISIMCLAAGCCTVISLRIALPSLVMTIPPMGSINIFSMERGPRHVRTTSAIIWGEKLSSGKGN